MYRLMYENPTPLHEATMGRFNDVPPNLIRITQKEWVRQMMLFAVVMMDYRQPHSNGNFTGPLKLFYFTDDAGVALQGATVRGRPPRFFTFAACVHTWRAPTEEEHRVKEVPRAGNCYHVNVCAKCGKVSVVDSSG